MDKGMGRKMLAGLRVRLFKGERGNFKGCYGGSGRGDL